MVFNIPILPSGRQIVINLLTTWGDQYYIGLTGLEIFTASGNRAHVQEVCHCVCSTVISSSMLTPFPPPPPPLPSPLTYQITSNPADINILPEYSNDPRVISNLLDDVNITRDDVHMWLTPYTPSQPHTITITFYTYTTIALIRVWVSH